MKASNRIPNGLVARVTITQDAREAGTDESVRLEAGTTVVVRDHVADFGQYLVRTGGNHYVWIDDSELSVTA